LKKTLTKEQQNSGKRRLAFAARLGAMALACAVIKLTIPLIETGTSAAPPEELSLAVFSSESLLPINSAPLSLSRLIFDLPFDLPARSESGQTPPEISDDADIAADSAAPSDSGNSQDTVASGSLFYIPDSGNFQEQAPQNDAIETTITGEKSSVFLSDEGIYFKNTTGYDINVSDFLHAPLSISAQEGAQVLIIHTHGSESYAMEAGAVYEESDPSRTTDKNFNVIHVGDVLTEVLDSRGISVIHDREMYDYPNYNGAYNRSYESIQKHLAENPNIQVVIDLHRDALVAEDGTVYKTVAEVDGETCSQVMLIVGSNWSGLTHPNWRDNLSFGFKLQKAMADKYPTLARPLKISQYRYNQQATPGSLIAEIGCNGNTLSEAVRAVEYFGDCLADVLGK